MSVALGRTRWAIAEDSIPTGSTGPEPAILSHAAVCLLNTDDRDADVTITLYFSDREPAGPYRVPARRALHVRFNDLTDPEPVPSAPIMPASSSRSSPWSRRHARLDSRQAENALMTTIACPCS